MTNSVFSRAKIGTLALMAMAIAGVGFMAGCAQTELPAHLRPLSKETMMLLGKKGMETSEPIFIRIFKEESEFEVWKQRKDGYFYHVKTYPICNYSGELGPKIAQGDKQAPEGFYTVGRGQMNPNSQFHLAFNLGYPNAFDRSWKRSGDFLMVHGKCKSAGCYAMTDALIEEIYALARESFIGGQDTIHVHAFPFRMTDANMARHRANTSMTFWQTLKEGYDHFETARKVPTVAVCDRRYVVNVNLPTGAKLNPEGACPRMERAPVSAFTPNPKEKFADERVTVPGTKTRLAQHSKPATWGTLMGLTGNGQ